MALSLKRIYALFGVFLLIIVFSLGGWESAALILRIQPAFVIAFFIIYMFYHLLRAVKLKLILGFFKKEVDLKTVYLIQLAYSFFGRMTPGRVGENVRYLTLREYGINKRLSLLSYALDVILDGLTILFFATLSSYTNPEFRIFFSSSLLGLLLFLSVLVFSATKRGFLFIDALLTRISLSTKIFHKFIKHIKLSYGDFRMFLGSKLFPLLLLLAGLQLILSFSMCLLTFSAIGLKISFLEVVGIESLSLIAGFISMIPGGVGVVQGSMVYILQLLNDELELNVAGVMLLTALSYVISGTLSYVSGIFLIRKKNK